MIRIGMATIHRQDRDMAWWETLRREKQEVKVV
jgi:hypothetical protein